MDTSKLSPGQIIAAIGGIVLIISLFLDWVSGLTVTFGAASISASQTAWDAFSGMDIIMLVVGIGAVAWAAAWTMDVGETLPLQVAWFLTVSALVVFGWALGWDLEVPQAGIGAWIAMFAALAVAYGAFSVIELRPRAVAAATPRRSAPPGAGPGVGSRGPGTTRGTGGRSAPPPGG
jgi:hypothetical protein